MMGLPIIADLPRNGGQDLRGQALDLDPGKNQKAIIVFCIMCYTKIECHANI